MAEGIYQVRGLDLSNMTFVEGDTGVIVIDPLISAETAAAALALYREHRGDRPVTAVIYTHSHVDHFGGVTGVIDQDDVDAGQRAGDRAGGLPRARGRRERLRGHGDGPPRRLHVRRGAARAARRARSAPVSARRPRPASVGLIAPTLDITHTGQTRDGRRRRDRVPADARAPRRRPR